MQLRKIVLPAVLAAGSIAALTGLAQGPNQGIRPNRHPNLAAAQRLTAQAFQRIQDAQQANEWDMNGHAQKAKELLDQANRELAQAAGSANRN